MPAQLYSHNGAELVYLLCFHSCCVEALMKCCSRFTCRMILLFMFIPKRERKLLWVYHLESFSLRVNKSLNNWYKLNCLNFKMNLFLNFLHNLEKHSQQPICFILHFYLISSLSRPPTMIAQATKPCWAHWKLLASQKKRSPQFIRSSPPFCFWYFRARINDFCLHTCKK